MTTTDITRYPNLAALTKGDGIDFFESRKAFGLSKGGHFLESPTNRPDSACEGPWVKCEFDESDLESKQKALDELESWAATLGGADTKQEEPEVVTAPDALESVDTVDHSALDLSSLQDDGPGDIAELGGE